MTNKFERMTSVAGLASSPPQSALALTDERMRAKLAEHDEVLAGIARLKDAKIDLGLDDEEIGDG